LSRWHWFFASLVLGVIWSAWHLPLDYLPGTTESLTPPWAFFVSTTALASIMTWIYLRTGRNLLAMLLVHTFVNIASVSFPPIVVDGTDRASVYLAYIYSAIALPMVFLPSQPKPENP